MGWVKLDDTFTDHPKVEMAGDNAAWLYVAGLLYAYRADTDGFIPNGRVPKLTNLKGPKRLAQRLVDVKLWEVADDGYVIHDYLDHQQSAADREEQRAANADRLRKHREKRRSNGDVTALQRASQRDGNANVRIPEGDRERELEKDVRPSSVVGSGETPPKRGPMPLGDVLRTAGFEGQAA